MDVSMASLLGGMVEEVKPYKIHVSKPFFTLASTGFMVSLLGREEKS
jgi:hypothetical protein